MRLLDSGGGRDASATFVRARGVFRGAQRPVRGLVGVELVPVRGRPVPVGSGRVQRAGRHARGGPGSRRSVQDARARSEAGDGRPPRVRSGHPRQSQAARDRPARPRNSRSGRPDRGRMRGDRAGALLRAVRDQAGGPSHPAGSGKFRRVQRAAVPDGVRRGEGQAQSTACGPDPVGPEPPASGQRDRPDVRGLHGDRRRPRLGGGSLRRQRKDQAQRAGRPPADALERVDGRRAGQPQVRREQAFAGRQLRAWRATTAPAAARPAAKTWKRQRRG